MNQGTIYGYDVKCRAVVPAVKGDPGAIDVHIPVVIMHAVRGGACCLQPAHSGRLDHRSIPPGKPGCLANPHTSPYNDLCPRPLPHP